MKPSEERSTGITAQEMGWKKMLSEEKNVRALIYREFAASNMNNTKWKEFANTLYDLRLSYTIKFVDGEEPMGFGGVVPLHPKYWDGPFGPLLTLSIEWLDINPIRLIPQGRLLEPKRIDYTEEVENRLQGIQVPYHKKGQSIRIVGHVRNAVDKS